MKRPRLSRRARWWLVPRLLLVWCVAAAVFDVVIGEYAPAAAVLCIGLIVMFNRATERNRYRAGWVNGWVDAHDEMQRRFVGGDREPPASVVRMLVTGSPAPEPWDGERRHRPCPDDDEPGDR